MNTSQTLMSIAINSSNTLKLKLQNKKLSKQVTVETLPNANATRLKSSITKNQFHLWELLKIKRQEEMENSI